MNLKICVPLILTLEINAIGYCSNTVSGNLNFSMNNTNTVQVIYEQCIIIVKECAFNLLNIYCKKLMKVLFMSCNITSSFPTSKSVF